MLIKWQYLYSLLLYWNALSPETGCYDILNKITLYKFQAQLPLNGEAWVAFHISGLSVPTGRALPCEDEWADTAAAHQLSAGLIFPDHEGLIWGRSAMAGCLHGHSEIPCSRGCLGREMLIAALGFSPQEIAHTFPPPTKPQCTHMITSHAFLS